MFIEDGFKDCCDDMADVSLKDGFYDEEIEIDWKHKEKEDYGFAVGSKEQMSLSTKTVKTLAKIRNDI